MQTKQLQTVLSKVATATAFALFALAPLNVVSADDQKLQSVQASQQDMLEFLDKHSTAPSEFETKTIKLGYNDDEQALFSKELYRKKGKPRKAVTKVVKGSAVEGQKDAEKPALTIDRGDVAFTFGGATKIEHYFQRNASFLNRSLPDEAEYFKNTFDLSTDFAYGEKRFGHKAIEAYVGIMHKGVWGKNGLITDTSNPTSFKLSETNTYFGDHTHQNGRPFVWIKEGWLRFSLNAIADAKSESVHYVKLGWFPFSLGRGISLGAYFGLNRELLGLYSYYEEKCAPGINVGGDIVKDTIAYDLYWSRFEERNRDLRDTAGVVRLARTPQPARTWRGLGKDNDVLAARLKVKPVKNDNGSLEVEPYIMYNTAPDQQLDILADSDTKLGTVGLAVEQSYKNFEWGGEIASNFGKTTVFAIDQNSTEVYSDLNGKLGERYTKVVRYDAAAVDGRTTTKADRNAAIDTATIVGGVAPIKQLTYLNPNAHVPVNGGAFDVISAKDRFRAGYENKFGGWMGVIDAAYNFKDHNAKLACGIGYASGDQDPDINQTNKTYKGFVGVNELYSGKRVLSVLVLDERKLQRPSVIGITTNPNGTKTMDESAADISFSDLVFGGVSAMWKPHALGKNWQINPNGIMFWKAYKDNKPILSADGRTAILSDDKASTFMGTELNLLTKVELLKDFNLFANFAVFVPGQYFRDFTGVDVGGKKFVRAVADDTAQDPDFKEFRLAANPAFHANVGLSYKF